MKFKNEKTLNFLWGTAFLSTGISIVKIYPFFLLAFIITHLSLVQKITTKKIAITTTFLMIYVTFVTVYNYEEADLISATKFFINLIFLISSISWFNQRKGRIYSDTILNSLRLFIILNFIQTLYSVASLNLWSMPLNIQSSSTSYEITQGYNVIFGEQGKNIWATKICIALIMLISFEYLKPKTITNRALSNFTLISIIAGLFSLIYISSRTAQLAFITFICCLIIFHYKAYKRPIIALTVIALSIYPILYMIIPLVLRINISELSGNITSAQGDGLLARMIIWSYLFDSKDLSTNFFGGGFLTFGRITNGIFTENNAHNVFINTFLDFGYIGLTIYMIFFVQIFFRSKFSLIVLAFPMLVIMNSQYLGYDSDLVSLFVFAYCLVSPFSYKYMQNRIKISRSVLEHE